MNSNFLCKVFLNSAILMSIILISGIHISSNTPVFLGEEIYIVILKRVHTKSGLLGPGETQNQTREIGGI